MKPYIGKVGLENIRKRYKTWGQTRFADEYVSSLDKLKLFTNEHFLYYKIGLYDTRNASFLTYVANCLVTNIHWRDELEVSFKYSSNRPIYLFIKKQLWQDNTER